MDIGRGNSSAGEAAHAGHPQIEQNQIDLAVAFEDLGDLLEGASLADFDTIEQGADGLTQRTAEQRVIVGNQQMMRSRLAQW